MKKIKYKNIKFVFMAGNSNGRCVCDFFSLDDYLRGVKSDLQGHKSYAIFCYFLWLNGKEPPKYIERARLFAEKLPDAFYTFFNEHLPDSCMKSDGQRCSKDPRNIFVELHQYLI